MELERTLESAMPENQGNPYKPKLSEFIFPVGGLFTYFHRVGRARKTMSWADEHRIKDGDDFLYHFGVLFCTHIAELSALGITAAKLYEALK